MMARSHDAPRLRLRHAALRGQQLYPETPRLAPPSPVVRGPARFHMMPSVPAGSPSTNRSNGRAGQPLPFDDPSRSIRESDLENALCQIDRHVVLSMSASS